MQERGSKILSKNYSVSYERLSGAEKRKVLGNENLSLSFLNSCSNGTRREEIERLRKLGYSPISLRYILGGVAYIAAKEKLELPYPMFNSSQDLDGQPKKTRVDILTQQETFMKKLISKLRIEKDEKDHTNRLYVIYDISGEEEITDKVGVFLTDTRESVEKLYENRICLGRTIETLKIYMNQNRGILGIFDSPIKNGAGPSLEIKIPSSDSRISQKHSDKAIAAHNPLTQHFSIVKEVVRFGQLEARRNDLQVQINNGKIKLVNVFMRDNWPTHPLMSRIKTLAAPMIADEVRSSKVLCDEQDIRYQTLFRLTTFPLHKLFYHGDHLHSELTKQGSYHSWAKIPKVNESLLEQFNLDENLVRSVIREQLIIIKERLENSDLPLEVILIPKGIFTEKTWKVVKEGGSVYAANKLSRKRLPISFKQIGNDLATSFHRDLHYIHTPRSGMSFGLFLENQELPFSVLATEKIDRNYKKNVLLALGYDPDHCIDFTRLYSWPGAPFNTSSSIFACAFQYLEENQPDTQAALSAFMPSYASGLSMISGGFDLPVIIKDGKQRFQEQRINTDTVWKHVTLRNQTDSEDIIESVIPMFPTVELLRPIKKPRFEPLRQIDGKMFVI